MKSGQVMFADAEVEAFETSTGFSAERHLAALAAVNPGVVGVGYEADPADPTRFVIVVLVEDRAVAEGLAGAEGFGDQLTQGIAWDGEKTRIPFTVRTVGKVRVVAAGRQDFVPNFNGGVSIGSATGWAGTLGCKAWKTADGPRGPAYLLTCEHVIRGDREEENAPVVQPGRPHHRTAQEPWVVGALAEWAGVTAGVTNRADAAIARSTARPPRRGVRGVGAVRTWRQRGDVPVGGAVVKSGAERPFISRGVVLSNRIFARWDYPFQGTVTFGPMIMTTSVAVPGDSGTLLLMDDDHSAVGLVTAVSPGEASGQWVTFVSPIDAVQDALDIRVAEAMWVAP